MPRFSANLSLLFTELPLLERFIPSRGCGFTAAEIQFPYETPARQIKEQIDLTGLEAGVYFYTVSSENYSNTKRLVVK